MPIEKIREKQQKQEEAAAQAKAAREATAAAQNEARQKLEREKQEAEQKRQDFVIARTEKVLNESKVLESLRRIDTEILSSLKGQHGLAYSPENGKATLAWGDGFKLQANGTVNSYGSDYSYSTITITVNPDTELLTIQGRQKYEMQPKAWKNFEVIEDALSDVYLDPAQNFPVHESSSNDNDSGCCCGT